MLLILYPGPEAWEAARAVADRRLGDPEVPRDLAFGHSAEVERRLDTVWYAWQISCRTAITYLDILQVFC